MAATLLQQTCRSENGTLQTFGHMSADMQGTVTSLYEVGAFFGAMACLWIGEPLGRRRTCFLGAVIMIIGAVLQAAA